MAFAGRCEMQMPERLMQAVHQWAEVRKLQDEGFTSIF